MPKMRRTSIGESLDVTLVHYLLDTWVFQFIIESLGILIGIQWKTDLRASWFAENYYPMVIGWSLSIQF
jgi:hypothetical protein